MGDQSILDEIDRSADLLLDTTDESAAGELGERLAVAAGRNPISTAMVAYATLVADLINSLPAEIRGQTLVVFMRLVQRMMDEPEDHSLH